MVKHTIMTINDKGAENTVNSILKSMLEKGMVSTLLLPVEIKGRITIGLISKPEMLDSARPLVPIMPVSTARMVSDITRVSSSTTGKTMGVVLRSCELRALTELVKLKQASLENLVLIGVDCFGTFSINQYDDLCKVSPLSIEKVLESDSSAFREACQICEYPEPVNADLTIGLFGNINTGNILMQAHTEKGENILKALDIKPAGDTEIQNREKAIQEIKSQRSTKKAELFEKYTSEFTGLDKLQTVFAGCINCHNCRVACPICYCRECLFDSPTFEWKADNYLDRAEKRGTLAMPGDRMLFHLTRLNHMVTSCVGCGLCQEACPNNISVFPVFRLTADRVQASFNYVPGRSPDEQLPISEFRENELDEIGK